MIELIQGDCIDKMKELPDNSVDSVVTDPPYELGFMGKHWDNTGIANNPEMWKEALRVLKPGGHLLAFSGTRTYHRMAVAIEDAGFEVRDMIEWVYGSGFPKSLNIGKAVDKLQGNEREDTGEYKRPDGSNARKNVKAKAIWGNADGNDQRQTKGTSQFEGWGTALKPAHEPICMARKPLAEKTVAENVLKYGTGGINIDESRVGTEIITQRLATVDGGKAIGGKGVGIKQKATGETTTTIGRFPANLLHDNSEEVRECFPESKAGSFKGEGSRSGGIWAESTGKPAGMEYGDSGNASRFFKSIIYQAKASKSERNKGLDNTAIVLIEWSIWNEKHTTQEVKKAELLVDMGILQPKDIDESGTQQREGLEWNTYLFGKSLTAKYQKNIQSTILTEINSTTTSQIFNWLVFLLTNEYIADVSLEKDNGGNLVANADNSKVLTITMNEALASRLGVKNAVLETQLKISVKEGRSGHPTVKPVALMEYLIKMVTPKSGTVLDPFMGSGSTGVACKQNGFNFIGIDMTPEYVEIAKARMESISQNLFNV